MHRRNVQAFLLKLVPVLRYYLKSQLGLKLHPKKISLQPVFNGVRFLGCFVKPSHIVVNKRIIRNFKRSIALHNYLAMLHKPNTFEMQYFISSVNSYLGIMRHYKTYRIRSHILKQDISSDWKKHICFQNPALSRIVQGTAFHKIRNSFYSKVSSFSFSARI